MYATEDTCGPSEMPHLEDASDGNNLDGLTITNEPENHNTEPSLAFQRLYPQDSDSLLSMVGLISLPP